MPLVQLKQKDYRNRNKKSLARFHWEIDDAKWDHWKEKDVEFMEKEKRDFLKEVGAMEDYEKTVEEKKDGYFYPQDMFKYAIAVYDEESKRAFYVTQAERTDNGRFETEINYDKPAKFFDSHDAEAVMQELIVKGFCAYTVKVFNDYAFTLENPRESEIESTVEKEDRKKAQGEVLSALCRSSAFLGALPKDTEVKFETAVNEFESITADKLHEECESAISNLFDSVRKPVEKTTDNELYSVFYETFNKLYDEYYDSEKWEREDLKRFNRLLQTNDDFKSFVAGFSEYRQDGDLFSDREAMVFVETCRQTGLFEKEIKDCKLSFDIER